MLWKKMLRDMKQQKAQFLSIFFMCFLGLCIYSGIYSEWRGMEKESERLYEACNLADAWILGNFEDGIILEQNAQVTWEGRTLLAMQDQAQSDSLLDVYALDAWTISTMQIQAGVPYDATQQGIWMDQAYAEAHQYQIGDMITLQTEDISITAPLLGVGYHPEYVYAQKDDSSLLIDHTTYGFAIVAKQAYAQLQDLPYQQLVVKKEDAGNLSTDFLPQTVTQVITRNEHPSVQTVTEEISQHRAIGSFFPIVFLLIAMLSTLTTMRKMVKNQRLQIGTLKALGFNRVQLYRHYLSHIVWLCAAGVASGLLVGVLWIPSLIYAMQKTMYTLPIWQGHVDGNVFMVAFLVLICCFLSCYLAIHQDLKESSASLMRPKLIKMKQHETYEALSIWKHMNFYTQWNLRDMLRNAARTCMAIIGIMGCSALLLCALGAKDSIINMIDLQYQKLQDYEAKLLLSQGLPPEDVTQLETIYAGETIMEGNVQIQFPHDEKVASLRVQKSTQFLKLTAQDDIALPKEGIVLSQKLAQRYDLQVGDVLTWKLLGNASWVSTQIAAIVHTPLGQGIMIDKEYYETLDLPYQATAILTAAANIEKQAKIVQVCYRTDAQKDMDTMLETMQVLIFILIIAALLLGSVVLYNFTSLSFFERTREMATLKVLGFNHQSVMRLTRSQNMQICILAILMGIPLGYTMLTAMMTTFSEAMDIMVYIHPGSYAFACMFPLLLTLGISQWMARKVRDIDMVTALKVNE